MFLTTFFFFFLFFVPFTAEHIPNVFLIKSPERHRQFSNLTLFFFKVVSLPACLSQIGKVLWFQ